MDNTILIAPTDPEWRSQLRLKLWWYQQQEQSQSLRLKIELLSLILATGLVVLRGFIERVQIYSGTVETQNTIIEISEYCRLGGRGRSSLPPVFPISDDSKDKPVILKESFIAKSNTSFVTLEKPEAETGTISDDLGMEEVKFNSEYIELPEGLIGKMMIVGDEESVVEFLYPARTTDIVHVKLPNLSLLSS